MKRCTQVEHWWGFISKTFNIIILRGKMKFTCLIWLKQMGRAGKITFALPPLDWFVWRKDKKINNLIYYPYRRWSKRKLQHHNWYELNWLEEVIELRFAWHRNRVERLSSFSNIVVRNNKYMNSFYIYFKNNSKDSFVGIIHKLYVIFSSPQITTIMERSGGKRFSHPRSPSLPANQTLIRWNLKLRCSNCRKSN